MMVVTVFIKQGDPAAERVVGMLNRLKDEYSYQLAVVPIDQDEGLRAAYEKDSPVVQAGPYRLGSPFDEQDLRVTLGAALDRARHLNAIGDNTYARRIQRGRKVSMADRVSLWLSNRYMLLINFFLFLYVGLPFLAPVLALNGIQSPARVLYTIYSPLCHQLTFRSWFLFGMQPYYPRSLAQVENLASYEQLFNVSPADLAFARQFTGMEEIGFGAGRIGYKVALCQRDVAIYASLLGFGLVFSLSGRKIKSLPWYLWIIFGLLPIGLDGFSQLPSLLSFLAELPVLRESTPLLRTITGVLFGSTTGWYLFPMIEESMRETRALLTQKQTVVSQIQSQG
ncbi:MAG: DUF2085 domain-containing protein [Chloroflexota bacterium]|nr:MAG: hypothetical protein KatS3mg047_0760 [Bellilinea sp.]